ncbi:hypothetical protein VKT23_015064 [Stygiomarasmius scandens]|uniref:Protein-S-isoprenylcysteine O-methyltransferase n=1 Tax=Marasmiellus scandens TaxID=2682957 RepID=A0ABR1IYT3_9AGAR
MIPIFSLSLSALILVDCYLFWRVSVPPRPPASLGTETKRLIPFARLAAQLNSPLCCALILFDAYCALSIGFDLKAPQLIQCPNSSSSHWDSPMPSTGALFGYLLIFTGGYIRITSQRLLGKYFTWEISFKEGQKLCTTGPYSLVRHPGYLGLWLIRFGINFVQSTNSWSGLLLRECLYPRYALIGTGFIWENYVFTASLLWWMTFRAKWEDDLMKENFRDEWNRWAQKTRYRIVPFVY